MNVGDVLRVYTTLSKTPKEKIVLCVTVGPNLFLWFNTEADRNRPAQMAVAPGDAPEITKNCFLNCGRATTFPEHELAKAKHCGRVSPTFLARVITEVEDRATSLTNLQRKSICAALRAAHQGAS